MMHYRYIAVFFMLIFSIAGKADAALIDQINTAFRSVHGRNPNTSEWHYWATRITRGDKTTYDALMGAITYQKLEQQSIPVTLAPRVASARTFVIDPKLYPSHINPNFYPNGTLIKSSKSSSVFYVENGTKSWVLPGILDRWLGENHYFKHDIIITIPESDLARYPQKSSVNKLYIGKILIHPKGNQFYIDDKLRKRTISASARSALKIPGGNFYPTTAAHLKEFNEGPAITKADKYPGGMVVYTGLYHGGRFWKIEEAAGGKLTKRLYLVDYLYEADGYPDESQRAPANEAILTKHERGPDIGKYADGWVVGLGSSVYVVQDEMLRLITAPNVFSALGYKEKYVVKVYPELLKKYARGHSIAAFKEIVGITTKGGPAPAPSSGSNLTKVRPAIRTLISNMNTMYLSVFDKDVTDSENKFWVDYVYNGEISTKEALIAEMKRAKSTGQKPSRTSRTQEMSEQTLESYWFPYLFYFVHQKEPSTEDKDYWYSRITPGDRNTIEKLGGTLQWIKDTSGVTRK